MLRLNMILGFQYRASTRPRLQTFKIRFENEYQVGTPIRQNLDNLQTITHNHNKNILTQNNKSTYKNLHVIIVITTELLNLICVF